MAIQDNEEEMNWRIFFAHSQDMQGFRADIFTGGANEGKNPYDPAFVGLRERWGSDSRSLITDLAPLWDDEQSKAALIRMSNPFRSQTEKREGVRPAIQLLLWVGPQAAPRAADGDVQAADMRSATGSNRAGSGCWRRQMTLIGRLSE